MDLLADLLLVTHAIAGAIFASIYLTIASRFDQRIKALEYDFDILVHSLDVLVENGAATRTLVGARPLAALERELGLAEAA